MIINLSVLEWTMRQNSPLRSEFLRNCPLQTLRFMLNCPHSSCENIVIVRLATLRIALVQMIYFIIDAQANGKHAHAHNNYKILMRNYLPPRVCRSVCKRPLSLHLSFSRRFALARVQALDGRRQPRHEQRAHRQSHGVEGVWGPSCVWAHASS